MKEFSTVKEFVNWLIDNESKVLADGYGRQWKYEGYKFQFKDIGTDDVFKDGLHCVHLFSTVSKPDVAVPVEADQFLKSKGLTPNWFNSNKEISREHLKELLEEYKSQSKPIVEDKEIEDLKNELINQINGNTSENEEDASWGYEEGVLLSVKEAKLILNLLSQSKPIEPVKEDEDEIWNEIISTARWHNGTWEKERQDRMVEYFKQKFSIQRKNIKQ